jgi:hypothetical protein
MSARSISPTDQLKRDLVKIDHVNELPSLDSIIMRQWDTIVDWKAEEDDLSAVTMQSLDSNDKDWIKWWSLNSVPFNDPLLTYDHDPVNMKNPDALRSVISKVTTESDIFVKRYVNYYRDGNSTEREKIARSGHVYSTPCFMSTTFGFSDALRKITPGDLDEIVIRIPKGSHIISTGWVEAKDPEGRNDYSEEHEAVIQAGSSFEVDSIIEDRNGRRLTAMELINDDRTS